MFCKNCGKPMTVNDNFCTYCNAPAHTGNNYCSVCGVEALPNCVTCGICGNNLSAVPYSSQQDASQPGATNSRRGFAIASLVLGIVGIVTWCTIVMPIICGIAGVIFGCLGLKSKPDRGLATAGLVVSIISLSIFAIIIGLVIAGTNMFSIFNQFTQFSSTLLK
ncbi:MAG: hypothetical protein RR036_00020 [Oscillospiraceae bacterium]